MEQKSYYEYEHQCVENFRTLNPSATVYHISQVGEDILYECGWIPKHDTAMRDIRLARLSNGGFVEYGLDGLAKNSDGSFTGLQSKLYLRKMLKTECIATFVEACSGYIHISNEERGILPDLEGVLYCPPETRIHDRLERSIQQSWLKRRLGLQKLPFRESSPTTPSIQFQVTPRGYQEEAVSALTSPSCPSTSLLVMPCGVGKT